MTKFEIRKKNLGKIIEKVALLNAGSDADAENDFMQKL